MNGDEYDMHLNVDGYNGDKKTVEGPFNEKGFNKDGIHKDTGVKYDIDGYTVDGLDKNGKDRFGNDRIIMEESKLGAADIAKLDLNAEITPKELTPICEKGIKAFIRKMMNKLRGIGE